MSYKEALAAGIFVTIAIFAGESRGAEPGASVAAKDASIPFVNSGTIRDWRADGSRALYIQDVHGQWYHATLMGTCPDLPFTESIRIDTTGPDRLDKFGTIIVRGQRCAIQNFVRSAAPPPSKAKRNKVADKSGEAR